jgi:hypothetical protein
MPGIVITLKRLKWQARVMLKRGYRCVRYQRLSTKGLPIIFGNAMAKSGSHIIKQFLEGLSKIGPMVFTDQHPIRTILPAGTRRDPSDVISDINRLKAGDTGWGYLPAREPYLQVLNRPEIVHFFVYRDPRDKIISHIFYAMDIHQEHAMHAYYHKIPNMEDRIAETIRGVPGMLQDIQTTYESYIKWLDLPSVVAIRFEDLIYRRDQTLAKMLTILETYGLPIRMDRQEALKILNKEMSPERSPTFRSGKSGGWRQYFTEDNIALFKEISGDLLVDLGYEDKMAWD